MTLAVPNKVFFTRGVGHHKDELRSFEIALRQAGIEKCNLVTVSSILPPQCKIISQNEGLKLLHPGGITFAVIARCCTDEPRRHIAAAIGCAVPHDRDNYGYIAEYHGFGKNQREAGDYVEDMAAAMLATTLGIEFDEDKSWDEKEEVYRLSGKIVLTRNITQCATTKPGGYTTALAAAVFLFNQNPLF